MKPFQYIICIAAFTLMAACGGGGGSSGGSSGGGASSTSSSSSSTLSSSTSSASAKFTGASEILLNKDTTTSPYPAKPITVVNPITLSNGDLLITWGRADTPVGGSSGIYSAQRYNAPGNKIGSEIPITDFGMFVKIAPLSGGGFVAIWDSARAGGYRAQAFNATGGKVGSEVSLPLVVALANGISIAPLSGNRFVVAWVSIGTTGDQFSYGIAGQIFDGTANPVGGSFLINTEITGDQSAPHLSSLPNGGFIATWCDDCSSSIATSSKINAQLFDSAGNKTGGQIHVPTDTTKLNLAVKSAVFKGGDFVVIWEEIANAWLPSESSKIRGQIFSSSGTSSGSLFTVITSGDQSNPDITALSTNGFVLVWHDGRRRASNKPQFYLQAFSEVGAPIDPAVPLANALDPFYHPYDASLGPISNGGFAVSWQEFSASNIFTSTFAKTRFFTPTPP